MTRRKAVDAAVSAMLGPMRFHLEDRMLLGRLGVKNLDRELPFHLLVMRLDYELPKLSRSRHHTDLESRQCVLRDENYRRPIL